MLSRDVTEELSVREAARDQIRVGIAGAGFIGRGLINQISLVKGIKTVAVAGRNTDKAAAVLNKAGLKYSFCKNPAQLRQAAGDDSVGIVADPLLLSEADVDIVVDCTGNPGVGAALCLAVIAQGKHFIASPEMDATVGPVLQKAASAKGVVYSGADGDEPGVAMGLYRYVSLIGMDVIAVGKFKGYYNRFATPSSVKPWADGYRQNPYMISSFADGSKMNIEMAILANATGFVPDVRGMHCPSATLNTVTEILRTKEQGGILQAAGVVEVVRDVEPGGGVFVVAATTHGQVKEDLRYLKMGNGPNYLFYRPYHLGAIETILTIVRVVLYGHSTISPAGQPVAEVICAAKKDLEPGDVLDSIGGYSYYGLIDCSHVVRKQALLPVGLAEGAVVVNPVRTGEPIRLKDIEADQDSLLWKLWRQEAFPQG
jgi:predicted homoserine dehydrogenase-like protein